jgi:hypothetical protein
VHINRTTLWGHIRGVALIVDEMALLLLIRVQKEFPMRARVTKMMMLL